MLLCITVSSIASLAVVATISEADALSTVALALAVLAFAAQLIVTLAQNQSTSNQTRDTFRINAETRAVLAEIQAQSAGLVSLQSNQFDKLLSRLLDPNVLSAAIDNSTDDDGEESSGGVDSAAQVDPVALAAELKRLVSQTTVAERRPPYSGPKPLSQSSETDAIEAVSEFRLLTPEAQDLLLEIVARPQGAADRLVVPTGEENPPGLVELRKRRFVTFAPGSREDGRPVALLRKGALIREYLRDDSVLPWAHLYGRRIRRIVANRNVPDQEGA